LIAFASISLVVSSIMISIITYVSVLERTKEIGVLRALGARKKDISRVFNTENIIIGFSAGLVGIIITLLLMIPLNIILENLSEISNIAKLSSQHIVSLIAISVFLAFLAGLIPARMAAKKDPVEALRTE
jgi:putative ABC transport system permease protein